MSYTKSFPRTIEGSAYPRLEEVSLTAEEDKHAEQECISENTALFKDCLSEAASIVKEQGMKDTQSDIIAIAIALFEKRASHIVHWKERKAKEKFGGVFPHQAIMLLFSFSGTASVHTSSRSSTLRPSAQRTT